MRANPEFENPGVTEREQMWQNYIPPSVLLDPKISLKEIARRFEITGANIVNIIHYAGLQTLENHSDFLSYDDLMKGIRKEYRKEGKMIRLE